MHFLVLLPICKVGKCQRTAAWKLGDIETLNFTELQRKNGVQFQPHFTSSEIEQLRGLERALASRTSLELMHSTPEHGNERRAGEEENY